MAQNRLTAVGRVDGHHVADLLEVDRVLPRPLRRALAHAEREAHRGGDADRRGAANDHRADGAGHLLRRTAPDIQFLAGQLALIDHHDRIVLPIYGGEHRDILGDNSQLPTSNSQGELFEEARSWELGLRRLAQPLAVAGAHSITAADRTAAAAAPRGGGGRRPRAGCRGRPRGRRSIPTAAAGRVRTAASARPCRRPRRSG